MHDGAGRADEAAASGHGAGELEAADLEVLQRGGSALSPGEVRELIGGDLAYTTVVTILSRLHAKGVLDRRKSAAPTCMPRWPTRPASPPAGWPASLTKRRREAVLARFVSALSDRDEELLRRMLADPNLDGPGLDGGGWSAFRRLPPLLVPVVAASPRGRCDRLPPAAATWLLAASALALALASRPSWACSHCPRWSGSPSSSARAPVTPVIRSGDAVSVPVAIVAGGLLVMAAVAACRACGGAAARSPWRTGTRAACLARARWSSPRTAPPTLTRCPAGRAGSSSRRACSAPCRPASRCPALPRALARPGLALSLHVGRAPGRRRQPAPSPGRRPGQLRRGAVG